MENRVAVTGLGLHTIAGDNIVSNLHSLKKGEGLTSSYDRNWNEITDLSNRLTINTIKRAVKNCIYDTLKNATIMDNKGNINLSNRMIMGVVCGSNFFETSAWENEIECNVLFWTCNSIITELIKEVNVSGPVINVSTACSSGASAIVTACQLIESDQADVVIAIGYDFRARIPENGMKVIGAISKTSIAPFCLNRTGTDLADGIGVMVLEKSSIAKSRNTKIYANIIGYGVTSDAFNITAPDPEGKAYENAMKLALRRAEIEPSKIQYINTHGSGTPTNDEFETRIIKKVFKEHSNKLLLNSSKSIIGHTLGAAGLIEAIITVLALETGWIHKTANYTDPDPNCDLNYCTESYVDGDFKYAMSNSIGFGGTNVSIVLEKGI